MLPVLLNFGVLWVYSFGLLMVLAVLLGMFLIWKKMVEVHVEEKKMFDLLFLGLFWGLVGARFGYIFEHWTDFGFNLLKWVWLNNYVGLSFWPGFWVGSGVVFWKNRKDVDVAYEWLDYVSIGMSLAIGVGMVGCFLNGCALGVPSEVLGIGLAGVEGKRLPIQLVMAVLFIGFCVWWWKMEREYRTVEWYRAGRVTAKSGFLWFGWLVFLGVIMGVSTWFRAGLLEVNGVVVDRLWAFGTVMVGASGLFLRSGRKVGELFGGAKRGRRRRV
jgi:phosphatidylglycerol---prolipoprotein diacylglyceryl transferase